jgi:hypothetical protein
VSCSLIMWSWLMLCSANADLSRNTARAIIKKDAMRAGYKP